MLKNILKLDGAQKLSKNEQKSINGGKMQCADGIIGGVRTPCRIIGKFCAEVWCQFDLQPI